MSVLSNPAIEGDSIAYEVEVLEASIPEFFGRAMLFIDPRIAVHQRPWCGD